MNGFPWAVQVGAVSEQGTGRRENADRAGYVIPPPRVARRGALFAVADGVGGGREAAMAARAAIRGFLGLYYTLARRPDPRALLRAVQQVQQTLRHMAQGKTTLTGLLVGSSHACVVHVGDTRAYLVRNRHVYRLTRDDVLYEGDPGRRSPFAHVLTQALGMSKPLRPHVAIVPLQSNDVFVLTSDGVHAYLPAQHIGWFAVTYPPLQAAALMARWALNAGSSDDRTVLVVRVALPQGRGRVSVRAIQWPQWISP